MQDPLYIYGQKSLARVEKFIDQKKLTLYNSLNV